MLEGLRLTLVSREEYVEKYCEDVIADYIEGGGLGLYQSDGNQIGRICFYRRCGSDSYYAKENPGWHRLVMIRVSDQENQWAMITEDTFNEEMLEAMWNKCLQNLTPEEYVQKMDNEEAGFEPLFISDIRKNIGSETSILR